MNRGRVFFVFAIFIQCSSFTLLLPSWTNEITLPQGKLRGRVDRRNGYNAYLGIPYASVPHRFQDAGPARTWNDTLFADNGSIKCNQYFDTLKMPIGQEDCLVSNIFTPINEDNSLLPVMVFIHGGGYDFGSNTDILYNPKHFIQKNVIVVTINYRLGAFGFLCLPGTKATGNIGLKDAVTALKWIKSNIEAFGGNPNTLTVFGESAGATSVHYLIVTGKYKGLFDKAILQSGSILMPNKFDPYPIKAASNVAAKIGQKIKTEDPEELLEIFQKATANDIIEASHVDSKNQPLKLYIFRPCEESLLNEHNSFVKATPKELVNLPLDTNLDVILGYNNKEGIKQAGQYDLKGLKDLMLSELIPENIIFSNETNKEVLTNDIRKFYFPNGIDYDSLIDYFSDSVMIYPSITTTNSLLSSNVTVYNYYFKYDSLRNGYKFVSGLPLKPGATHADELFYMFDPVIFNLSPIVRPLGNDLKMIDTLTTLWTSFAKTRKPSSLASPRWIQSGKEDLNFLQLDTEKQMIPLPNKMRYQFWKSVYEKYSWI